jgi:MOSC domain-containing protein YiiM
MTVTNLFVKHAHGEELESVAKLDFNEGGIIGGVSCSPLRQVLLTSQSITAECGLRPGDLRENIVVDFDGLYQIPSGTIVMIGAARIRLTFHCEPCKMILKLIEFNRIVHKRGVLGCFLNSGTVSVGDAFAITDEQCEAIPYAVEDRIRWLLGKQEMSLARADLVHTLGLPSSYSRVMGRILQKLPTTGRSSS